jgi:hypothetical protein
VKKAKRTTAIRLDEKRPSKAAAPPEGAETSEAEIPKYRGPSKTDKMPRPGKGRRADQIKPSFDSAKARRPRKASREADLGDQQPRRGRAGGGSSSGRGREQYVRLRVRVTDGRLSIVESHLVDGPLGQATGFPGGNAYEVTLGDRLLHAGALPDLGVQRSFPNPKGPPEQHGHFLTDRRVYEFMARVPAEEVRPDTIGEIAVRLHRVKQEARVDRIGDAPLAAQFERDLRPIAELVGLPDSVLPEAIEKRGGRTPSV